MKTENGLKKNYNLQIRLDREQLDRLKAMASANGYGSVSDFVRYTMLNPTIEMKLNRILSLIEDKEVNNGAE